MQSITHRLIFNRLAKADALFGAVGIATTVLESALIATNKNFGATSLELSLLCQILLSVIIESSAGVLFLKLGPFKTTLYGMITKIFSITLLGVAVVSSNYFSLTVSWFFLLTFFITDAVGSGCLLSAFRPAYGQWFSEKMNHTEEADFLKIFKNKMLIRIGLPLVILLFSVGYFYVTQTLNNYFLYSSVIIIGTMLVTRLYQLWITSTDFKELTTIKKVTENYNVKRMISFDAFKKSITKIKTILFIYVLADVAHLSVMMYAIGLGFKLTARFSVPFYFAWLGGALIGFIIYLISSLFGYFVYPRFSEVFHHKKIAFAILLLVLPTLWCVLAFSTDNLTYQIVTLFVFSLCSVTVGNGLLRLMTNQIIKKVQAPIQQSIFIFAEALASLSIAIGISLSLYSTNGNATILTLLALILIMASVSVIVLTFQHSFNEKIPVNA